MLVKLLINPLTKSSPRSIHFIFQIFLIVCCQPIHMLLIFEKKKQCAANQRFKISQSAWDRRLSPTSYHKSKWSM